MTQDTPPFRVGDRVTTALRGAAAIVRTVTRCEPSTSQSGWWVWVDGGEPCPHCGRVCAPLDAIDSSWFKLAGATA